MNAVQSYFVVQNVVSCILQIHPNVLKVVSRVNADEELPDQAFAQQPVGLCTCPQFQSLRHIATWQKEWWLQVFLYL